MNDIDSIRNNLKAFREKAVNAANDAIKAEAEIVRMNAIDLIRTPSNSGKTVKRGNRVHTISKRGEAPNSDWGNLVNSIFTDNGHLHSTIYALPNYALYLETYLERPFLSTAFKNQKPQMIKNIAKAAKAAFK